jgi:4-hydroxy-4-methyl-2-oxoglutarate aldolase
MSKDLLNPQRVSHSEILELQQWSTPAIYNGLEQITSSGSSLIGFNIEEAVDFMPHLGIMAGFAATLVIEPSNANIVDKYPDAWSSYRHYVASVPDPKILVVQDLDKPLVMGSFWGEVNSNTHRALGCVGTITDGGIRDFDEMSSVGFKALARRLCVGHAYAWPLRWNCRVEIFGCKIEPGQLIIADQHGFIAVPQEDEKKLLEATRFMDRTERRTLIQAAREAPGKSYEQILDEIDAAEISFRQIVKSKYKNEGE